MAAMHKYILLCLCFVACRKAINTTSNTGNPATVKLGECVNVLRSNETIKLCLDSLNDSRCPINVECIWAGVAIVKLKVTGTSLHAFRMSTNGGRYFPPNDTLIENHRIQLNKVLPYPGDGSHVSPRIELNID